MPYELLKSFLTLLFCNYPILMCNVADKDKQTEGEMSGLSDQEEMEKNKYHILMHIYGI